MFELGRRPLRAVSITLGLLLAAPVAHTVATPTPASAAAAVIAKRGDRSPTVATVQRLLLAAGVPVTGGVDGIYGPGTTAAVTEYQRRRGLPQTGAVDVGTGTLLGVVPATPILAKGARGAAVTDLQKRMITLGIAVRGGADGIFGSATAAALAAFQTSHGIPATGSLDAGTDAVLTNAVASVVPPAPAPAAAPVAAPAPAPAPADVVLGPGSRGPAVAEIQRLLAAAGFTPNGGADGIYGSSTTAKVKAFQTARGLAVNGTVDAATRAALVAPQPANTAAATPGATPAPPAPAGADPNQIRLDYFPITPTCSLRDSFGYPRSGGRRHEGIDILAARGTPIYAVKAGRITALGATWAGPLAGNAFTLTMPDDTYFFHAHLDHFAPGIGVGSTVAAGTLIGYVGSTGNAGTPHLHLEVHPKGGPAVNPYPIVRAAISC